MSGDGLPSKPQSAAESSAVAASGIYLLPPEFRFHPTDEELVSFYLKRKVLSKDSAFSFRAISDVDIYRMEPWDLPGKSSIQSKDREWYFFCSLDRKYSKRPKRATGLGYWKEIGRDRAVRQGVRTVGMRKTLVFHLGRAPKGERTDWVMHEYRLEDEELARAGVAQDAYVVCRIFQKGDSRPFLMGAVAQDSSEQETKGSEEMAWSGELSESSVLTFKIEGELSEGVKSIEKAPLSELPEKEMMRRNKDLEEQLLNIAMEVPFPSRYTSPRSRSSLIADKKEKLLDSSKDERVIDQSEIHEQPITTTNFFDEIEKPVLDDEPSLTKKTFDIGVPTGYKERGPLNGYQLQITKAFVATLHENIESGAQFTDVLQTIKKFTSILVTLHTPLNAWDSLAHHVLAEVQRMEALRGNHEGVEHKKSRTLSSLRAKFEECLATVNEDNAKLVEAKEKLASVEQERASSMEKFDNLQKQLADLQNQMEDVEATLNLSEDSMEIINRWTTQKIERIEYIESAILALHESMPSRVSSFPFGREMAQPDHLVGDTYFMM